MYAVYVRVSTEEQAINGYSISHQLDECRKKAKEHAVSYIDDGYSGEFLERPALSRLREDVRKGIVTKVICYDPDRLARKLMLQLMLDDEFHRCSVELEFVNGEYAKTPEGQLFFSLRGAVAEFEKAKIRERTMAGKKRKAMEGKVVKHDHTFGYDWEDGKYVINEHESAIVQMMFQEFVSGRIPSLKGLAEHMSSLGVLTKRGKKHWHRDTIRGILQNEIYTGRKIHNRYNTEGLIRNKYSDEKMRVTERPKEEWIVVEVPRIINDEIFQRAQVLLEQIRRRSANMPQRTYLLSGLVRCKCGRAMHGRVANRAEGKVVKYACCGKSVSAKEERCYFEVVGSKLEDKVWSSVVEFINNPEALASSQDVQSKEWERRELKRVQEDIEKQKKGRKRLVQLLALSEEDMDISEVKEQIREMQEKESLLVQRANQLQQEIEKDRTIDRNALKDAAKLYFIAKQEEMPIEIRQRILRILVKEIRITSATDAELVIF